MKNRGDGKFSIDGFKKWMSENGGLAPAKAFEHQEPLDEHIGQWAGSRLSTKKLAAKIEVVSGEAKDIIMDFASDGGTIMEAEEDKFLIEVDSGRFYLPRHCIKRAENS